VGFGSELKARLCGLQKDDLDDMVKILRAMEIGSTSFHCVKSFLRVAGSFLIM
jgi:hypothetical protein